MNERISLAQALRLARQDLQSQPLPAGLEQRLADAVRAATTAAAAPRQPAVAPVRPRATGQRPAARRAAWLGLPGMATAGLGVLLAVLLLARQGAGPAVPPDGGPAVASAGVAGGFVPLVAPERWPQEAAAAWLIDAELPGERLAALGLPPDPARAGRSVRAQMLVHASGELLAVRFVH